MLLALDLMNEIFYIVGAVLIAVLAVEIVDIICGLVLVLSHCLHGGEALVAIFERAFDLVGRSSHCGKFTAKASRR